MVGPTFDARCLLGRPGKNGEGHQHNGLVPGTFLLTFDTELVWGSLDRMTPDEFERRYPDVRSIIGRIIRLLESHQIPATWAVVGHLFLAGCRPEADGQAHPAIRPPPEDSRAALWMRRDPCTSREADPLFYGDDIVDALMACRTQQEIASHSFFHIPFDASGMTADVVRADLAECRRVALGKGIALRSFVFPRNHEAHHDLLAEAGFTAYRGADPSWHAGVGGAAGRVFHFVDQLAAVPPTVSVPREKVPGLWNIPGSMLLLHRSGLRRAISVGARVTKARRGLERAVRDGAAFHLWTHPFNLASDPDAMMAALSEILADARAMRERGELQIETMASAADRVSDQSRAQG